MAARESRDSRDDEMAYILDKEFLPVYVGKGLGDMLYEDAVELSRIKRTALGLRADWELISMLAPPPRRSSGKSHHTPRASKNNPYKCVHCNYKTTRYGNMIAHLKNLHDDYYTDPRYWR